MAELELDSQLSNYLSERNRLQAQLAKAHNDLLDNLRNYLERTTDNAELHSAISFLYWWYDFIPTALLAEFIGRLDNYDGKTIVNSTVYRYVLPANIPFVCAQCSRLFKIQVTSKYAIQSGKLGHYENGVLIASDTPRICPKCEEQQKLADQQRADAYWAKQRQEKQAQLNYLRGLPYPEYLQTEHWKAFRKRALRRAGYCCQLCSNDKNLNVHHRTYERRGEEEYDDVIVLCQSCHAKFHDKLPEVSE